MPDTKTCNKCGESKPPEAFHRNASSPDGLQSWCRDCKQAANRQHRRDHPDQMRERDRQRRQDHREERLERDRQYHQKNPLRRTWQNMLARCENPNRNRYGHYGARGITVCAAWRDYETFAAWIEANLGPRPDGMTLDRINNDGNYEPGNMRWATAVEQRANRRDSRRRP